MRFLKVLFVFTFSLLLHSQSYGQIKSICVSEVFSVIDIEHVRGEKVAILDDESNKLILYDIEENKEIWRIGRKGKGPGEFTQPSDIAVSKDGSLISVRDFNKRISEFGVKEGKFIDSYVLPRTLVSVSEGFAYYNNNYIIGGMKSSKNRVLLQVYNKNKGKYKSSFLHRTKKAKKMGILSINDISIAVKDKYIYSVHQSDYVLSKSNVEGKILKRKKVSYPKYFKEINSKEPNKMDKLKAWMKGNSMPKGIYMLDNRTLITYVSSFGEFGGHIDVIKKNNLNVVNSIPVKRRLYDVHEKRLFMLRKLGDEPKACIDIVDYNTISN